MVRVVVDSTADIPQELVEAYGITVVPLSVQFGRETLRDGVDISRDEFYRRLAQTEAATMPKTSQPALGDFEQVYRKLLQEADGVLSIHISGKLSGTVRAAQQAAQMVDSERIAVLDSYQAAMTEGFMAFAAIQAAREGKGLAGAVAAAKEVSDRAFIYVGIETLRYLQQGGRIGRLRAFLGGLLNVKPIFEMRNAEVSPVEQVRSTKRVVTRLKELVQEQGPLDELAVLYTSWQQPASDLADQLAAAGVFPRERMVLAQMGAVIGTHIGPGGLGVNGIRKAK